MKPKQVIMAILAILFVVIGAGKIDVLHVGAEQAGIQCDSDGDSDGNVDYRGYEDSRGIEITVDEIEPKGVVVVGQDAKRLGVSFRVSIRSMPGTIIYEVPYTVCGGPGYESKNKSQGMGEYCGEYDHPTEGHLFQFAHAECDAVTEEVYRGIEEVQVWLEPTPETVELLYGYTDKSVPKIYPQYWIEYRFSFIGGGGFPNIDISELPYLDAGGRRDLKKGQDGLIVFTPDPRGRVGFALHVFRNLPLMSCASPETLNCDLHIESIGSRNISFTINPTKLPIQFPGKWNIVVYAILESAQYGNPKVDETLDPSFTGDDLTRYPDNEEADDFFFESYAIVSSPCNPGEEYGCTDTP